MRGEGQRLRLLHALQDKEPRGIIPLENLSIREVDDPRKPVSPSWPLGARGGPHPGLALTCLLPCLHLPRIALSCTSPTTRDSSLKPAKPRPTAAWWRGTIWSTGSQHPRKGRRTSGSNPSSEPGRLAPQPSPAPYPYLLPALPTSHSHLTPTPLPAPHPHLHPSLTCTSHLYPLPTLLHLTSHMPPPPATPTGQP